jgi:DNA-binding transcriptional MerR regulator
MNANLEKVLRVLNKRGLIGTTSETELAQLSELSRKIINQSKHQIQQYLLTAPQPSNADEESVDEKLVETYISKALEGIKEEEHHFGKVLGAIAGFVLRQQTNLINNIQRVDKIVRVGQAYINLVTQIEARKDGKGTPIHSQSKDAKYLQTELNNSLLVKQLFSKSRSHKSGEYSKKWKLTKQANQLNQIIMQETIKVIRKNNVLPIKKVTVTPLQIASKCSGQSVTSFPANPLSPEQRSFQVSINQLGTLSVPSFLQIMNHARPSLDPNEISVTLKNLANVDPKLGRTYNVFTRLRSYERKALGYLNYDISGGLQIIAFGILYRFPHSKYPDLDSFMNSFPMIFNYGWDPVYKQSLRQKIAGDLGVSVDEVKKLLTAYANGSQKQSGNSSKLKQFQEESDQLRREVISTIQDYQPSLLKSAIAQSKKSFPEDMDWQSIEKESTTQQALDKASVFFFIWTHFEKQIRDAMLSLVDDGIPVHDAIYSKQQLPLTDFEKAIHQQTGFEVKISH